MRVKNWSKFQHYKDRSPPWLKLHRGLVDDINYHTLSATAAKYLPLIWIVVSDTEGAVPASKTLAFRLRLSPEQTAGIIAELAAAGFLESAGSAEAQGETADPEPVQAPEHGASTTLAGRYDRGEERRGETEEETEHNTSRARKSAERFVQALAAAELAIDVSPADRQRWWKLCLAGDVTEDELAYAVGKAKIKRPKYPGGFVLTVLEGQRADALAVPNAPGRTRGGRRGYLQPSETHEVGDVVLGR